MAQSYSTYPDDELIPFVCEESDEQAFAELYRRHVRNLVHVAIRKTGSKTIAEDLVQETFVKFWLGRHKFDIQKNVRAYLNGMLKNNIITHYHQQQRQPLVSLDEAENPVVNDTQEHLNANVLRELYQQSLQKLPSKCRVAFELSRKGYSLKEIAHSMDISEKTVEAHISKALRILRVEMKDYIVFALIGLTHL